MSTPETKKTFDGTSWVLDETMKVTKIHAEAQDLSKENPTDVGYPLTLIGRSENRIEDIVGEIGYFNTGLRITPPAGYHIEIVARNGLHKTGYEIPSGLLVFNPSFNSEIIVPLRKFKEAEDLELPLPGSRDSPPTICSCLYPGSRCARSPSRCCKSPCRG